MAKNYYADGNTMDWSNSTGANVKSGDPVPVGMVTGVSLGDIPDGGDGALQMTGVFTLPKTTADAWERGDKVYLNPVTKMITSAADDGAGGESYPVAGSAWVSVGVADIECRVRLGF